MKLRPISSLIAAVMLTVSGFAMAEDRETVLSDMTSPVLVNQGGAYADAQAGMLLYPGDQLMVMNGGSAQVQFASGCVQQLGGNEILRIEADDASCTAAAAGTYQAAPTSPPGGGSSMSTGGKVALALFAAGGGYVLYKVIDDDDDRPPISP